MWVGMLTLPIGGRITEVGDVDTNGWPNGRYRECQYIKNLTERDKVAIWRLRNVDPHISRTIYHSGRNMEVVTVSI